MADRMAYVYVDLEGTSFLVGRLWAHSRRGRDSASFEYDAGWLTNDNRFALEPLLSLTEGTHHTGANKALFGAMGDSAPDRWGRILMRRAARRKVEVEGNQAHTLTEMDYLLAVNDEARQGALRFAEEEGGEFLAGTGTVPIPPLVNLPRLLAASENVINDNETDEDIRLLLDPGSSLGGARPKASVRDVDGTLAMAKFPRADDEYNTVLWEAVALSLAASAGIYVPEWRVEVLAGKPVLMLKKFDREGDERIPFLSAMSMIGAHDGENHSYLEIVDAISQYGASPKEDKAALWRRVVFNILISNTDDHLRNHAFLYVGRQGWRLSPAYDMNPTPIEVKARVLTTAIDLDDGTASIELAMSVHKEFGLGKEEAEAIIRDVGQAAANWRRVANDLGVRNAEINRMASAFEHDDLERAVRQ
jgi:serine/threonine-protein kinase HipA